MKVEIEEIIVAIKRSDAFDIVNCINKGDSLINPEHPIAVKFAQQLSNIFLNSTKGIHFTE